MPYDARDGGSHRRSLALLRLPHNLLDGLSGKSVRGVGICRASPSGVVPALVLHRAGLVLVEVQSVYDICVTASVDNQLVEVLEVDGYGKLQFKGSCRSVGGEHTGAGVKRQTTAGPQHGKVGIGLTECIEHQVVARSLVVEDGLYGQVVVGHGERHTGGTALEGDGLALCVVHRIDHAQFLQAIAGIWGNGQCDRLSLGCCSLVGNDAAVLTVLDGHDKRLGRCISRYIYHLVYLHRDAAAVVQHEGILSGFQCRLDAGLAPVVLVGLHNGQCLRRAIHVCHHAGGLVGIAVAHIDGVLAARCQCQLVSQRSGTAGTRLHVAHASKVLHVRHIVARAGQHHLLHVLVIHVFGLNNHCARIGCGLHRSRQGGCRQDVVLAVRSLTAAVDGYVHSTTVADAQGIGSRRCVPVLRVRASLGRSVCLQRVGRFRTASADLNQVLAYGRRVVAEVVQVEIDMVTVLADVGGRQLVPCQRQLLAGVILQGNHRRSRCLAVHVGVRCIGHQAVAITVHVEVTR